MVTKEVYVISYYRLDFIDMKNDGNDVYQNVLSENTDTIRYYAKKMEKLEGWLLIDFYEVWISDDEELLEQLRC